MNFSWFKMRYWSIFLLFILMELLMVPGVHDAINGQHLEVKLQMVLKYYLVYLVKKITGLQLRQLEIWNI